MSPASDTNPQPETGHVPPPDFSLLPATAGGPSVPVTRLRPWTGNPPDTVFLHGVLSSPAMWNGLSRLDDPLNAVALPLPGHFPWKLPPAAVEETLTDFAFLDAYRDRIRDLTDRRIKLVAHSTGALAALKIAAQWPELIGRVILFGAFGCGRIAGTRSMMANAVTLPWAGGTVFRLLYDLWLRSPDFYDRGLATAMAAGSGEVPVSSRERAVMHDLRRSDPESLRAVIRWLQTTSVTDDLAGIDVPVTVVIGARDPVVEADEQLRLARSIPGATAVICNTGHLPMFETPQLVRHLVAQPA